MKDLSLIVDVLMWILVSGLAFYILCLIIYCAVHRKRLPCIEDEHRKLKPKDVDGPLKLVSTPMGHENVFMKMYKEGREPPPTIRECVKICEENPEVCEMLAYLQKEKEEEMNNKMPALEFGDVVKYDDGPYGIVGNSYIYLLSETDGLIQITGVCRNKSAVENIVKVYRTSGEGFPQGTLYRIYTGLAGGLVIWKKPDVREMTVEQIEDQLGYKIKVVGNNSKGE